MNYNEMCKKIFELFPAVKAIAIDESNEASKLPVVWALSDDPVKNISGHYWDGAALSDITNLFDEGTKFPAWDKSLRTREPELLGRL